MGDRGSFILYSENNIFIPKSAVKNIWPTPKKQ